MNDHCDPSSVGLGPQKPFLFFSLGFPFRSQYLRPMKCNFFDSVLLGLFTGVGFSRSFVFVVFRPFLQWISSICFQKAEKRQEDINSKPTRPMNLDNPEQLLKPVQFLSVATSFMCTNEGPKPFWCTKPNRQNIFSILHSFIQNLLWSGPVGMLL